MKNNFLVATTLVLILFTFVGLTHSVHSPQSLLAAVASSDVPTGPDLGQLTLLEQRLVDIEVTVQNIAPDASINTALIPDIVASIDRVRAALLALAIAAADPADNVSTTEPPTSPSSNMVLYVSQGGGSDENTGSSLSGPLASLDAAIERARLLDGAVTSLEIVLLDAEYKMTHTVDVTNLRSDLTLVIRSGSSNGTTDLTFSRKILASDLVPWSGIKNVYQVPGSQDAVGLIVDGAIRPVASRSVSGERGKNNVYSITGLKLTGALELTISGDTTWRYYTCPINSYKNNPNGTTVSIPNACANLDNRFAASQFTTVSKVSNHPLFLTKHGDWINSSVGVLVYLNSRRNIEMIDLPSDNFLKVAGTVDNHLQNITIKNINFKNGGPSIKDTYASAQAGIFFENQNQPASNHGAALLVEYADNITLSNLKFSNLVGSGIHLRTGVRKALISGNRFTDVGANAIMVGTSASPKDAGGNLDSRKSIQDVRIVSNNILRSGLFYPDTAAVLMTYVVDSEIAQNTISNVPYTGISVGWGWTYDEQPWLKNNKIHHNLINKPMLQLDDGAGIYVLSAQRGTDIYSNTVQNMSGGSARFPIYLDQGSRFIAVRNNTMKNIALPKSGKITKARPIFGPWRDQDGSPCKKKACNITISGNSFK